MLRAERQADSIKSAIKRGVKFGRAPKFSNEKVVEAMKMQDDGYTINILLVILRLVDLLCYVMFQIIRRDKLKR